MNQKITTMIDELVPINNEIRSGEEATKVPKQLNAPSMIYAPPILEVVTELCNATNTFMHTMSWDSLPRDDFLREINRLTEACAALEKNFGVSSHAHGQFTVLNIKQMAVLANDIMKCLSDAVITPTEHDKEQIRKYAFLLRGAIVALMHRYRVSTQELIEFKNKEKGENK